ncbi:MAG TPA: lipopolysaccharide biosynthesis protein [Devosiaceae bacterium]
MHSAFRSALQFAATTGLSKSVLSLVIKVGAAGLTYAGFVVLSRAMAASEYGYFAFGFSLATILAIGAGMGQSTAILRFWPEGVAKGDRARAVSDLGAGGAITLGAGLAVGLGLAALCLVAGTLLSGTGPLWHIVAAGALVLPMALAEYNSAALRAQGSIWTALAPRDLLWRIALPVAAVALLLSGVRLDGAGALWLAAALLLAAIGAQYQAARRRRYELKPRVRGVGAYWRHRGRVTNWLLLGALINTVALNADTLVAGALLDPASAGAYFNAMRTAGLITLFSFSISLVIAPLISEHFHSGARDRAQIVLTTGTWAGFVFSLAGLVAFLVAGPEIMGLFGETYRDANLVLIVLGAGFVVDAATGPSRTVLMMTGQERSYAFVFGAMTVVSILAQIVATPVFGLVGIAVVSSVARGLTYLALSVMSIRRAGLDPTIVGILRLRR